MVLVQNDFKIHATQPPESIGKVFSVYFEVLHFAQGCQMFRVAICYSSKCPNWHNKLASIWVNRQYFRYIGKF